MSINVVELFAGVGGFRLGLEGWDGMSASSGYKEKLKSNYKVVWSNQFEPSTKTQHANNVYIERWKDKGGKHSDESIEDVIADKDKFNDIPPHHLLVGGFPCQDYSVATTLRRSGGLEGKKGVLWWSIYNILKNIKKDKKPDYLFLENVDRLLVSPVSQRGRDFAVMLSCLYELGYAVEWRVVNAAEYNMPQRRRRVYIVACQKGTKMYNDINENKEEYLLRSGVLAKAFKIEKTGNFKKGKINKEKETVSVRFNLNSKERPFLNGGVMIEGNYITAKLNAPEGFEKYHLRRIIEHDNDKVPTEFFIEKERKLKNPVEKVQIDGTVIKIETEYDMWKYLKGTKKEKRLNKAQGFEYKYGEGQMIFPDPLDRPARTIITGEGGKSPSRFKHVIEVDKMVRRLTPVELERANMFPDNHTEFEGITDTKRAFFMGNALVVGVVEKIGKELSKYINIDINQEEIAKEPCLR